MKKKSWEMFVYLWGKIPADCRIALIVEFIVNPEALRLRYKNELIFQDSLFSRWG